MVIRRIYRLACIPGPVFAFGAGIWFLCHGALIAALACGVSCAAAIITAIALRPWADALADVLTGMRAELTSWSRQLVHGPPES